MKSLQSEYGGTAKEPPRARILHFLREAGGWVSGEDMSRRLGVSRAAVAKHVGVLRAAGYEIDSRVRLGYRLLAEDDACSEASVRARLRTRVLGQYDWLWLEEVPSTNLLAARRAVDGALEGLVVVTRRQSAGRGGKGRHWFTAPRSLAVSVLLRPSSGLGVRALTHMAQQAAAEAVQAVSGLRPACKPPNDLLLNGRKLCGVLVEAGLRGTELEWAVVGIGVNVNARPEDFDGALANAATSLFIEGGRRIDQAELLACLLERLEALYLQTQTDGTASPPLIRPA